MILCADDFGISPGVSQAILELSETKKIDATSVMLNFPEVKPYLFRLRDLKDQIKIGWHVTLTGARPLSPLAANSGLVDAQGNFFGWKVLYRLASKDLIDRSDLKNELIYQWEKFEEDLGFSPHFIDGHHHAHQYPGIRETLLEVVEQKLSSRKIPIRSTGFSNLWIAKLLLRQPALGSRNAGLSWSGRSMKAFLKGRGIPSNRYLLGSYNPTEDTFKSIYQIYKNLGPNSDDIFYCHPGHPDAQLAARDSFVVPRAVEFEVLKSAR